MVKSLNQLVKKVGDGSSPSKASSMAAFKEFNVRLQGCDDAQAKVEDVLPDKEALEQNLV